MKVIAALEADFERESLGTRSCLRAELLGESVLRRTIRRVLAARRLASVHLVVKAGQEALAREAAGDLPVRLETHSAGDAPWRECVASSRKWSLHAWRGGVGGTTMFDEPLNPWVLEALARREAADAVAAIPAAAVVLDPVLLDAMIAHYEAVRDQVRWVFTQSAPGLTAAIYSPDLLADLARAVQPPGRTISYRPSDPIREITLQPCYYTADAEIVQAAGRCIADTAASLRRLERILRDCGGADAGDARAPDAAAVSRWLAAHRLEAEPLPCEVEIELTTQDSLPQSCVRPRGACLGRTGQMAADTFKRLIDELASRDDIRVVLGGFGDPLMHPDWPELVAYCRGAGIFGVGLRTAALAFDDAAVSTLIENRVDVLNVLLDAATAETYRRLHGVDGFERVNANIQRLLEAQQRAGIGRPLVICEFAKRGDNLDEMEGFYDAWITRTSAALISGPSHYARQFPDAAVVSMAPPTRRPCERIFTRALVLADGCVTMCDQDFRGQHALGRIGSQSLAELWSGAAMTTLRQGHLEHKYESLPLPLCAACEEWHRP